MTSSNGDLFESFDKVYTQIIQTPFIGCLPVVVSLHGPKGPYQLRDVCRIIKNRNYPKNLKLYLDSIVFNPPSPSYYKNNLPKKDKTLLKVQDYILHQSILGGHPLICNGSPSTKGVHGRKFVCKFCSRMYQPNTKKKSRVNTIKNQ